MYTRMLLWVPIRIGLGMLPLQCRRLGRSSESARHYILPAARRHRAATHDAPVSPRACGSGSGASDPRPIRAARSVWGTSPIPPHEPSPRRPRAGSAGEVQAHRRPSAISLPWSPAPPARGAGRRGGRLARRGTVTRLRRPGPAVGRATDRIGPPVRRRRATAVSPPLLHNSSCR